MEHAARLKELSITYEGFPVIDEVTVDFPAGKTTVIIGPSGCGKSTLMKAAAGLVPPFRGRVELLGFDLARIGDRELRELRSRNGFVFQDAALWQNLTVRQNLALPVEHHNPGLSPAEVARRFEPILAELGFIGQMELRPSQLSAGERKIVSFVRALVSDPDILFLDEPTTFVDTEISERMVRRMKSLRERGKTMVLVTHNPEITSQLADHVLVLKKGRLLLFGTLQEVVHTSNPEVTAILSNVLSEAATYDTDILSLLDKSSDPFPDM
ncbi:ABC transporter ATP-binding protein [Salinispira pacifica]